MNTVSPETQERLAERETRRSAIKLIAEQTGRLVEDDAPGRERLLLVKATRPDGHYLIAVLKLVKQSGTTHLDLTLTLPAEGHPAGDTSSFVLPGRDFEAAADSHFEIPTDVLKNAEFLTRELRTGRPQQRDFERREVYELNLGQYQQLSGNR